MARAFASFFHQRTAGPRLLGPRPHSIPLLEKSLCCESLLDQPGEAGESLCLGALVDTTWPPVEATSEGPYPPAPFFFSSSNKALFPVIRFDGLGSREDTEPRSLGDACQFLRRGEKTARTRTGRGGGAGREPHLCRPPVPTPNSHGLGFDILIYQRFCIYLHLISSPRIGPLRRFLALDERPPVSAGWPAFGPSVTAGRFLEGRCVPSLGFSEMAEDDPSSPPHRLPCRDSGIRGALILRVQQRRREILSLSITDWDQNLGARYEERHLPFSAAGLICPGAAGVTIWGTSSF